MKPSRQEENCFGQNPSRQTEEAANDTWHGTPLLFFCLFRRLLLRLGTPVIAQRGSTVPVLEFWAIKPNNLHLGSKSPIINSLTPSSHPEGRSNTVNAN